MESYIRGEAALQTSRLPTVLQHKRHQHCNVALQGLPLVMCRELRTRSGCMAGAAMAHPLSSVRKWGGVPSHDDVTAAIAEGARKVAAIGKPRGILTGDLRFVEHWLKSGFSFVACGSDLALLARGAENLRAQVAKMTRG